MQYVLHLVTYNDTITAIILYRCAKHFIDEDRQLNDYRVRNLSTHTHTRTHAHTHTHTHNYTIIHTIILLQYLLIAYTFTYNSSNIYYQN